MIKSAENKLIFLIASFCETPKEWIDVFSSPLPRIPGFPKRDKSIRLGISGLMKKGMLNYKEEKNSILIRPSIKAFETLALEYPFYNNFLGKWDGKLHLIAYDISESKRKLRDAIRWILKGYKLGVLSHSLYVSAYDIQKDLNNKLNKQNAKNAVSIFTVTVNNEQLPNFIKLVWNINALSSKYKEIISSLESGISKIKLRRSKVEVFRKSFIDYKKLFEVDPGLPFELTKNTNDHLIIRKLLKRLQKML